MREFLLRLLLLAGACMSPAVARAEPAVPPPRLVAIGDAESIPGAMVSALAEDADGFLWIATPAGLVRYDGYRFRLFDNAWSAPDRRVSLFVRSLAATADGRVWAGTDFAGLVEFDRHAAMLRPVDLSAVGLGAEPVSVNALAEDAGGLWIGTDGQGLLHRAADGALRRYGRDAGLPGERIFSLAVDAAGVLWVGTLHGLARRDGDRFASIGADDAALRGAAIRAVLQARDGLLWIGTADGALRRIDPATLAVHAVPDAANGGSVQPGSVYALLQANDGTVWVGRADGVDLRDPRDGALLQRLRHDPADPHSLAADETRALLQGRSGLVWIGGYGGGVQRYDPRNRAFRNLGRAPGDPLRDTGVRSIAALDDGRVALGTQDRGVFMLDANLEPQGPLLDADGTPLLRGQRITGLAQTRDGALWIGSDTGLYRHDLATHATTPYDIGAARARRMLAAPDGDLLVGTQSGLFRIHDPAATAARVLMRDDPPLDGEINALAVAGDGTLWIGGDRGLARLPAGGDSADWIVPAGDPLPVPDVLGIAFDAQDRLWFDTPAGLFRLDRDARQWHATAIAGVASAGARSADRPFGANLLFDARGRLWSQHHVYDPARQRIVALGAADGVDHGSAWFRAYAQLADGRMLFGGSKGVLVVQPGAYEPPDYDPPLVVADIDVDGLPRPFDVGAGITLAPGERGFALEYAALDYTAPERLRYRHRLDDYDTRWNDGDAGNRIAAYANLAPGDYRLHVQGTDRSGRWSTRELEIPVHIRPAWWQTWWARIFAAISVAVAIWIVIRLRTEMLHARQRELETKVRERTAELEAVSAALQAKSRALEHASATDPLTGLHNRRHLTGHIETDAARSVAKHEHTARAHDSDASDLLFFMIDLDHFKHVNDMHGHAAGDAVLMQMSERLRQVAREDDYVVRWGGEEFLFVAREADRTHAAEIAERVRTTVSGNAFVLPDGERVEMTCSIGFAAFPFQPQFPRAVEWEDAVGLADAALYAAKRVGRDAWVGLVATGGNEVRADELRDVARLQREGRVAACSSMERVSVEVWSND